MPSWLLLHGFTGSPESLQPLRQQLLPQRAVCPWLSGHGKSPALSESFEAELSRLQREAFTSLEPPVHLFGYSLGARLALGLAVRFAGTWARVVLAGVNPGLESDAERQRRRDQDQRWVELLDSEGVTGFVHEWERQPLFAAHHALPDSVQRAQREVRLGHTAQGLRHALTTLGLAEMPNYWGALCQLELPVTLVVGERDHKFVGIAERMQHELPTAGLAVVPGAGHNVLLEAPNFIAGLLHASANS